MCPELFMDWSDVFKQTGMPRFLSFFLPGFALLQVYLMVVGVQAGDEECLGMAGQPPIYCYDCTADSDEHFCGDPFNKTHPQLAKVACRAYCVKWSRTTLSGRTYYQRTCSDKIQIHMRKSVVCIEESRPSKGHLCFCDKDGCNHSGMPVPLKLTSLLLLALFITCIVSNVNLR